jgi:hypothetical protein
MRIFCTGGYKGTTTRTSPLGCIMPLLSRDLPATSGAALVELSMGERLNHEDCMRIVNIWMIKNVIIFHFSYFEFHLDFLLYMFV